MFVLLPGDKGNLLFFAEFPPINLRYFYCKQRFITFIKVIKALMIFFFPSINIKVVQNINDLWSIEVAIPNPGKGEYLITRCVTGSD